MGRDGFLFIHIYYIINKRIDGYFFFRRHIIHYTAKISIGSGIGQGWFFFFFITY